MIFFIHIPKTAGTSLLHCFMSLAGPSLLWYHPELDLSGPIPKAPCGILGDPHTRELYKLYGGHFGLSQIAPYLQEDDIVFSVVRDPVARAYSFYNHVTVNDPTHVLRPVILGLPIMQAARESAVFLNEIQNRQCWLISSNHKFDRTREVIEERNFTVFDVGQAQAAVELVSKQLGNPCPPSLPFLNESRNAGYLGDMTSEEIEFLQNINGEDQELYDWVLAHGRASS